MAQLGFVACFQLLLWKLGTDSYTYWEGSFRPSMICQGSKIRCYEANTKNLVDVFNNEFPGIITDFPSAEEVAY